MSRVVPKAFLRIMIPSLLVSINGQISLDISSVFLGLGTNPFHIYTSGVVVPLFVAPRILLNLSVES